MTIQDRIDDVIRLVRENIADLPDEKKEEVLRAVQDLGYQWQSANASHKATLVTVGMLLRDKEEEFDATDEELLKKLESEGSDAVMKEATLPVYADLVASFLMQADAFRDTNYDISEEK